LHSADELLSGVHDPNWRVRHESIDRLKARWHDDARTLPRSWSWLSMTRNGAFGVRQRWPLGYFDRDRVVPVLRRGLEDSNQEVRWAANLELYGLSDSPDLARG
jgi:hypothetical protein